MRYSVFSTCAKDSCIRSVILALFLFQLAIPAVSQAQTTDLRAGFAPGSIWMSRTHVVAGESVDIFTVLYNSSDSPVSGDIVIEVDGSPIGTKSFTLSSGESRVVSQPWTAEVGNHALSARIENVLGSNMNTNASISDKRTGSITVSIDVPPPPSPAVQVLNTAVSAIQIGVASSAPLAVSAAHSIYETAESLRAQAQTALEKQLVTNDSAPAQNPSAASAGEPTETPLLSKTLGYMAAAGLVVVSSKTLFYISLALILLVLIKILRVFLRERRHEG